MKRWIAWALLGGGFVVSSARAAELATPSPELLALAPADFERTASVKDDALELVATIATEPGYQEKHGLLRLVWSDDFLRAFVDKRSGATHFQLYQKILYTGRYYRYFETINYETPAGPKAVPTENVERTERCSRSQYFGGCTRIETLVVPLDAALLGTIAARYAPGGGEPWHFRFKAKTGDDYDGVIVPAEAAGLLAAVTGYKRAHGLAVAK